MNASDLRTVALAFNDCITRHDLDGLTALMTEDHLFVDREGRGDRSRKSMARGWEEFFLAFPEYKNTFLRVESKNDLVIMVGYAYWDEKNRHDPAIWIARVIDGLVAEWRIYYDTEENRIKFGVACQDRDTAVPLAE